MLQKINYVNSYMKEMLIKLIYLFQKKTWQFLPKTANKSDLGNDKKKKKKVTLVDQSVS